MNFRTEYAFFGGIWLILAILLIFNLSDVFAGFLIVRFLTGLVVVGYIPGYFLQTTLFPRQQHLTSLERFAVSVGLSLALIPLIALVLEYFSLGFKTPVLAATLGIVSIVLGALSWFQRVRIAGEERFTLFGNDSGIFTQRLHIAIPSRLGLVVVVLLGVALLAGVSSALLPRPDKNLTEFYLLDKDGGTSEYPKQVTLGTSGSVQFGIVNREGQTQQYRVEVWDDDRRLATSSTIAVQDGESTEQSLSFNFDTEGKGQQIQINLYRDDDTIVYRTLHLWVDVVPA